MIAPSLTRTPCVLCLSTRSRPAFVKAGHQHHTCDECGGLFMASDGARPDEDETSVSAVVWASSRAHLEPLWARTLVSMHKATGFGPLLDVGCGTGQFLTYARSRGWDDIFGVEPMVDAARMAQAQHGVERVHAGLLETAGLCDDRFAGAVLWDVIEHIAEPEALLREVHCLVRPGGVVVLSTPHRHGVSLRTFGARAHVVAPPDHLFYSTQEGMRVLLERTGYVVQGFSCEDVYVREWVSRVPRLGRRRSEAATFDSIGVSSGPAQTPSNDARYRKAYAALGARGATRVAISAVNIPLRALRLGDQLVATSRVERTAGSERP